MDFQINMMNHRLLILTAQVISIIFSPFYMPVMAFIALFTFSYMNVYPFYLKVMTLVGIYLFTILFPGMLIRFYRKLNGWSHFHLGKRTNRYVPYLISIICYGALLYLMINVFFVPHFAVSVIFAALILQILCAVVNNWIKISVHAAASGGVVGALLAYSSIFGFNPLGWLCLTIILCGLVGSARLILRQHKLLDIGLGNLIGFLSGFLCVLFF